MTRRTKNSSAFRIALLFLAFVLIKIGETAFWIITHLMRSIKKVTLVGGHSSQLRSKIYDLRFRKPLFIPKSLFIQFKSNFKLRPYFALFPFPSSLRIRRRRGRPRTQPLTRLNLRKMLGPLHQSFPRPLRWRVNVSLMIIFFVLYSFLLIKFSSQLPSPNQITLNSSPLTTQIFDRHGNQLYQFYEGRNRKLIKLEDLPPHLIKATISMEDQNFYSHPGIDPGGMLRAAVNNLTGQTPTLQGGSTITQQLIKNTLLTPDQTWARKLKEILLAFWTERIYSKSEILQAYFNNSPYGGPAWGIEAASEMYFGKKASDLTLSESAFLAGLPAAPTDYSPYGTHPERAKLRQKEVLRRMTEDGYISRAEADEAFNSPLRLKPPSQDIKAPHFVMYVRQVLAQKYGERVVSQGGLKVITTLDLAIQNTAEKVIEDQIRELKHLRVGNGAAMVTDPKTGQILAMVGSKNYFEDTIGNFNVTLALRQPGSAIKPVTYATAFNKGYSPANLILDTPTTFKSSWESYSPVNYDGKFHGAVTIRTALGSSYNVPAVKMLATVGIEAMINTASDLGITTFTKPEHYGLSLTLGGGAVRMIDMMSVYGTFATGGVRYIPHSLLLVSDSGGQILEDHRQDQGKRVLSEGIAYLISSILSDRKARAPAFGTNSLLEIPGHSLVAVKTGTSDDKRDNWAFGYTPEYVVGAWVGNNDNSPMDIRLTSGITGATPIWHQIMNNLVQDREDLAFRKPVGVVESTVDGRKDLTISGLDHKSLVTFQKDRKKDEKDGTEREVITYTDPFSRYTPDLKATQ